MILTISLATSLGTEIILLSLVIQRVPERNAATVVATTSTSADLSNVISFITSACITIELFATNEITEPLIVFYERITP
jgi:hypothetical protein